MHTLTAGLSRETEQLSAHVRRSRTWDHGKELASQQACRASTGLDVFFADPHGPPQRGTNENTNRLLRRCCPKVVSMGFRTRQDLDVVAAKLNMGRPQSTRLSSADCAIRGAVTLTA